MARRRLNVWGSRAIALSSVVPALLVGAALSTSAQNAQPQNRPTQRDAAEVAVAPLQGNLYMLVGAGANIVVQVAPPDAGARYPAGDNSRAETGVLVVDTGVAGASDKVRAAIRTLSNAPIRYIIDTNVRADHVGGNAALAHPPDTGRGGRGGGRGRNAAAAAQILAHESVLTHMSAREGDQPAADSAAWPTDGYLDTKQMYFNGESIQVFHQPAGTDGDSIVYFRRSDVVCAGDIFSTTTFPLIDHDKGGNINGIIDGLNRILDLTVVSNNGEGGTLVVPGHGRISDQADVVEYRNMVVMIRDRIQALVKQKLTLEQVKAAKPTLDYDFRYGATTGLWTTDQFIEAVYADLAKNSANPAPPGTQKPRSQDR